WVCHPGRWGLHFRPYFHHSNRAGPAEPVAKLHRSHAWLHPLFVEGTGMQYTERDFEEMAKKDRRHLLPTSVAVPSSEDQLSVVRCVACRRLLTEHEVRRIGWCPSCK